MIDTVVLRLPMDQLLPNVVCDGQREWQGWDRRTGRGYSTWVRNPTSSDGDGTHPRLTGYRDRTHNWRSFTKLEFSVPKLLWGNNLNEVTEADRDNASLALQSQLSNMGFNPSLDDLLSAEVIGVHYAKNFTLSGGYSARDAVTTINRLCQSGRLTKTSTDYSRYGSSVNLHNKSFTLAVYDKVAELDLQTWDRLLTPLPEVLRLEVRLKNRRKIKHIHGKTGCPTDPTFRDLFDPETSRRVLTTSWNELVVPQLAVISDSDETANDILARILRLQPEITVNKALKLLSLTLSGRSPGGLSELKSLVFSRMDVRSWYRLYREIKEVNRLLDTVTEETWWSQVNTQLAEYRLLTFIRN